MAIPDAQACPCASAHRRLMDLHEDIHRAIENYLDENEFRRWLNSAIQNSRGVTFLLQKQKVKWADFDTWYGDWQSRARENPVLGWGVTARNRIVKEEDLATLSQAVVGVYDTHRRGYEDVFVVPPSTSPETIIASFVKLAEQDGKKRKGWIRIERRWIDDQLPNYELVAALREMYRAVGKAVELAHKASGVDACLAPSFARECVTSRIDLDLHCLGSGNPVPTMMLDLESGEVATVGFRGLERDDSEDFAEFGRQHYGEPPRFTTDPIAHVDERMELSKQFLKADGYAGPILMLFGNGGGRLFPIAFGDDEPREMKIAAVLETVGAWQFTGAVFSSETWIGLPGSKGELVGVPKSRLLPSNREFFSEDSKGGARDEGLIVVGLSADGRQRVLTQPFGRVLGGYVFGQLLENEMSVPTFLRPLWERWR
ncbi:hypothetical protein J2Y69_001993 [Microbacterium resistens]|uniref:Uncharacterized protein n=1 Tax=Microbacterium resistens TaxID=156977 RepID=A0ABU1SCR9_9MICO|nr:hypothetical protein [Microbacterium resistens]MDR6867390.1 hypothetical protein [Microbacterium resistens]